MLAHVSFPYDIYVQLLYCKARERKMSFIGSLHSIATCNSFKSSCYEVKTYLSSNIICTISLVFSCGHDSMFYHLLIVSLLIRFSYIIKAASEAFNCISESICRHSECSIAYQEIFRVTALEQCHRLLPLAGA